MAPDSDLPADEPALGLRTHPLTGLVQGLIWAAVGSFGFASAFSSRSDLIGLAAGIGIGLALGFGFGFASWWFTRYVIDGEELLIHSGIFIKQSRRISYDRLQSVDIAEPLIARVLGLAELRIDMAGGKESTTKLSFLKLAEARELRQILLDRAHGRRHDREPVDDQRTVIAEVTADRLIIGTVLSLDFAFAVAGSIAILVAALYFGNVLAFLGGIIPLVSWLAQIVGVRVLKQWGYVISEGERGLRIERGLLSRTSQTIPLERVQGVAIEEPLIWRRFGWQRLKVDVAGYGHAGSDSSTATSSVLLPIADPGLASLVLHRVIAGARPDTDHRITASPRSWIFAPIGWRYRSVGADDVCFVAREGWMQRVTSIVPHHKTQSVEFRQGPLQRLRGVATLEVHTPKGPVDADGRHLEASVAREIAFAQLTRARAART